VVAELRLANQRFKMATEAVSGFIFEYDVVNDIVWRSKNSHGIIGSVAGEGDPKLAGWVDRIHAEDRENVWDTLRDALANRENYSTQYRVERSGRSHLTVWERGVVQRGGDRQAQRIVGYVMDITERQEAEEERARHLAEIEALNTRLQRAMTETHHRVKNNLQVVTALIDLQMMQARESVPSSELRRLIRHIRAISMIHDLLTHGAKEDSQVARLSASSAIGKLAPLLQQVAEDRTIHTEIDDALLTVRQGTALMLLIQELVSNAVKHGRGEIWICLTVARGSAVLEVCDDGPGFPEGFNPQAAANTGLDLIESLSRWDLQGQVAFENRPGGGGRAVVTFPVVHEAAVNGQIAPQLVG
jgi:two-component sensor histidine kinase